MASASGSQDAFSFASHQQQQQQTREYIKEVRIVVLGDTEVGKFGDAYKGKIIIDDKPVLLSIMDTAGQNEFSALQEYAVRCGEAFMICYSITDRCSFMKVDEYRKLIAKFFAADSIPIVLVGNKIDLDNPLHRQVSREEGQALAHSMGWTFFEISAANQLKVDDAYLMLLREIQKKKGTSESCREPHSQWRRFKSIFLRIFCLQQMQEFDEKLN